MTANYENHLRQSELSIKNKQPAEDEVIEEFKNVEQEANEKRLNQLQNEILMGGNQDSVDFEEGQLIGFNATINLDNTAEEEKLFSNDTSAILIAP